ncbi:MAG TPA: VWA domain-containing protein [Verrucomicrobiae bacterium]|nr:VWA domain-containing protein [Verrucomicrobiae bacterium]
MSEKPTLLSIFSLFLGGALLNGQQTATQPASTATDTKPSTLSVTVKVVNVPATVRDKHGQIISNLAKDDFALEEDGRPQAVRYFAHDTDLPLTLGLLVDTSMSQRHVLEEERHASYSFLGQMLRQSKDVAFVIHFDHEVELLQDLTSSRQKLESALQTLQIPQFSSAGGNGGSQGGNGGGPNNNGYPGGRGGGRHGRGFGGGGTLLYDSAYLASDELMKKQQGRKALIILSDGVDRGSKLNLDSAIESAQKADTIVYAILFKDDEQHDRGGFGGHGGFGGGMGRHGGGRRYPQEERPDGKKVLERISKQTGGRLFEVSKKYPIDKIYGSIAEELRNQYNLGYTPDPADAEGSFHKIALKTKNKDLTVQARDGYYAGR